ncbi:hypothetical protein H5410_053422 [Solanum commersonii]|uniref:DOG1 domain-containing protein n=1 Tax=Solanum commersonii TaxID=4109 RepID=A0A9J5X3T3_SOLCO|nr:hypothetical protein H5410_053422 [Solanum commersonii]
MPGGSYRSSSHDDNCFEVFLEGWLIRQEQFLNELVVAQDTFDDQESQENDMRDLISRVLAHYQEYYEEKSRMTHRNVFRAFSPTWFSPLERSFLWITGFNPGLIFNLVTDSVNDLSEHQVQRLNWLKHETKAEERERDLTTVADLARRVGMQVIYTNNINTEIEEVDGNIDQLKTALENVVTDADRLRTRTAERVVGLLNPLQSLKFLSAVGQLQLRVRMIGMEREAERQQQRNEHSDGW